MVVGAAVSVLTASDQRGGITINTNVISVPVTVLDERGRFVQGLTQQDFDVREDGLAQQITSFAMQEAGISIVLLMDVSGSMGALLDQAKRAAISFIRKLGPRDTIKIIQFDDKPTSLSDFSSNTTELEAAINSAKIGGATALYDSVYAALAHLQTRTSSDGSTPLHRAVIVLSDGEDSASALNSEEVLQKARSVDAVVLVLSLDGSTAREVTANRSIYFLRSIVELTGGQLLFPEVSNLQRAYQDLSEELRHQYLIGYVPAENEKSGQRYRRISVQVKNRRNVVLRHRQGYFTRNLGAQ